MNNIQIIASQLNIQSKKVDAVIDLLDSGNTMPFIARYRKERTGELDEDQIRQVDLMLRKLRKLDDRRETVVKSVEDQGKMTPELHQNILAAANQTELEDLYQPYKPKRRTRATTARKRGLQGLADLMIQQSKTNESLSVIVKPYLSPELPSVEEVCAGGRDIVAEMVSDNPAVRKEIRTMALLWGVLYCQQKKNSNDPKGIYKTYYDFSLRVDKLRPHQILAINRGEAGKFLRVTLEIPERDWLPIIKKHYHPNYESPLSHQLELAIQESAERLLLPSIERAVRRSITELAERHAIDVFARNLRSLLNQSPFVGQTVLGIDPGFRTGCKIAVVDETGKVLETNTIYPHAPVNQWSDSIKKLSEMIAEHNVTVIAIGNGTASRETEHLAADLTSQSKQVRYAIVNEAGASVYSASSLARAELPDMNVSIRGAVSIARRLQDPLAELVKIDPKSIGIGLYQYDIDQRELKESLESVVESVVNNVGVDVNTASSALLKFVAGVGPKLAESIVKFRDNNGPFADRDSLHEVRGLGARVYEQAAGFLRIRDGDNLLDSSAIHPESYGAAEKILALTGITASASQEERRSVIDNLQNQKPIEVLANELDAGVPTLKDIFEQLVRPGRDPREDLPAPLLRNDVLSMDDLSPGLQLSGTVRNVVDFGAFVDIGVKRDGLLHRSQIPNGIQLEVGNVIELEIQSVDVDRERISLTWIGE